MATIRDLYDQLLGRKKKKKKDEDEDYGGPTADPNSPNYDLSAQEAARKMAENKRKKREQMEAAGKL